MSAVFGMAVVSADVVASESVFAVTVSVIVVSDDAVVAVMAIAAAGKDGEQP